MKRLLKRLILNYQIGLLKISQKLLKSIIYGIMSLLILDLISLLFINDFSLLADVLGGTIMGSFFHYTFRDKAAKKLEELENKPNDKTLI